MKCRHVAGEEGGGAELYGCTLQGNKDCGLVAMMWVVRVDGCVGK